MKIAVSFLVILLISGCVTRDQGEKAGFYYDNPYNSSGTYYKSFNMPERGSSVYLKNYFVLDEIPQFNYSSSFISSTGYLIHTQSFHLHESEAVVLLIHGYLSHTGAFSQTIKRLLLMNYSVVTIDLPGHGLSSGPRGDIDSFKSYGSIVKDITAVIKDVSPEKKIYAIGHSTGATALIEYVLGLNGQDIDKLVLACPLIKNIYWGLTSVGYFASSSFIDRFPFKVEKNDPVDFRVFPMSWYTALRSWNEFSEDYGYSNVETLLLQAGKDSVVSNSAAYEYVDKHLPNYTYYVSRNSSHVIFKEHDFILDEVFHQIKIHFDQ